MYVKSLNMHVYLQLAEKKLSGCIFLPQSTMHKEVRVWQKVTVLWTKRSCMVNHNCYSLWYDRPGSLSEWALLLYTLRVTLQSAFQTAAAQVGRIKIYGDEGFSFFFSFFFWPFFLFPSWMTAIFAVLWSTGRTLSPGEVWRIKKTSPPCRLKRSSHAGWQFRYRRPDTRSRRTYSRSCGAVRQRITYSSACQLIIWTVKRTRQEKKKKKINEEKQNSKQRSSKLKKLKLKK